MRSDIKALKRTEITPVYEMGCPLLNASLFTLQFLIVKKQIVAESNFSVKSEGTPNKERLSC